MSTQQTEKVTPMMAQWYECKKNYPDALLFFRLGDFYEAFHDDAVLIAKEINLTLTERQGTPMCGVPFHSSEAYIDRLIAKGYRVAVAEQLEDPRKVKGIVKRGVVRCISPGSQVSSSLEGDKSNTFFAALSFFNNIWSIAFLDASTGTFFVSESKEKKDILSELVRFGAKELLVSEKLYAKETSLIADIRLALSLRIQKEPHWRFDPKTTETILCNHFHTHHLDGFGFRDRPASISAGGALYRHIKETLLLDLSHVKSLKPHKRDETLFLDRATMANLELMEPIHEGKDKETLISLLDETKTPMGARLLRQWLKCPLIDQKKIEMRYDTIDEFFALKKDNFENDTKLSLHLALIKDIERLIVRITTGYASPRDYTALKVSLQQLPQVRFLLKQGGGDRLQLLSERIDDLSSLQELLEQAVVDSPPLRLSDGDVFCAGYNEELDSLRHIKSHSKEWLLNYQNELRESTGIKTVKVGFNKMFGYYIEVSRGQADKMPDHFSRRQTLVNGERYISPELKEFEEKIFSADEKIQKIENQLFNELREKVSQYEEKLLHTGRILSAIDALFALMHVAERYHYVRPEVNQSNTIEIRGGRHPLIEALQPEKKFVENDLVLHGDDKNLAIITGPNMAGKSTFIRQVALIVLMAQMGSFVPAQKASIGIVDKLFSRIGASDDLARGQSTFMVEMAETASILNQATPRSLILLDEIGRGTSTYDGISIAWSVAEFLAKKEDKKAKTLFATHYFELTDLEELLDSVTNITVQIAETSQGIQFLHKIIKGKADKSYGIHVAKIAGLPPEIITRAENILLQLEEQHAGKKTEIKEIKPENNLQLDFFSESITNEIKSIEIDKLTPIEALVKLSELKNKLNKS